MNTYLTGITGGIGSGKSMVSRILRELGHPVYDCDMRAKAIMDSSDEIKNEIRNQISEDCIDSENCIVRERLASIVFSDSLMLDLLNAIVHKAIKKDLINWADSLHSSKAWVESAILYESELDKLMDEVWEVIAPEELRIERVVNRNGITPEDVRKRIESQKRGLSYPKHHNTKIVVNDEVQPLLNQVLKLLS